MKTYRNGSLINQHPCFNHGAKAGRIHLPVCPSCNIFCNFCVRKTDDEEWDVVRPGLSSGLIAPEEAGRYVADALHFCPDISVVGIAGPGDTLATDHALRAFASVHERFPHLLKCMSTNGLRLSERLGEVIRAGVDTLTVTVNAVDPGILKDICSGIIYQNKLLSGAEGAEILIANQLGGIKAAALAGITIKVNMVLIPEINGDHVKQVAHEVGNAGASIFNIIPLIPQNKLSECAAPNCGQIADARADAETFLPVFKHCQHCRADAVGLLGGRDFGREVFANKEAVADTFSHG
ncbi:MAG: radical SAM protein [Clostridiales Family XIII bacterium]|nr:radical SAM protein [Clostridiales Family XIII bacterium]